MDDREFFANQILKDVDLLSVCLQHSPEESLLLVHYLLSSANRVKSESIHFSVKLETKADRNKYEEILCKEFIKKAIGNDFDKTIEQMNKVVADDTHSSGSYQLFKISYDLLSPDDFVEANESSFFNNKKYW